MKNSAGETVAIENPEANQPAPVYVKPRGITRFLRFRKRRRIQDHVRGCFASFSTPGDLVRCINLCKTVLSVYREASVMPIYLICLQRIGYPKRASEIATSFIDTLNGSDPWIGTLAELVVGRISDVAALFQAKNLRQRGQAHFYVGHMKLSNNELDVAKQHFGSSEGMGKWPKSKRTNETWSAPLFSDMVKLPGSLSVSFFSPVGLASKDVQDVLRLIESREIDQALSKAVSAYKIASRFESDHPVRLDCEDLLESLRKTKALLLYQRRSEN